MKRFEVFANDVLIGWSNLEKGDPPMGVAFGIFVPNEKYIEIQAVCRNNQADQTHLKLSIKFGNKLIQCKGVGIADFEELGEDEIEVSALGIPFPLYEEIFPGRYTEYEDSLKK